MLVPRKSCPKCQAVYEGPEVHTTFSCEQCGCSFLNHMQPRDTEQTMDKPLPRSGGGSGLITHTRDGF